MLTSRIQRSLLQPNFLQVSITSSMFTRSQIGGLMPHVAPALSQLLTGKPFIGTGCRMVRHRGTGFFDWIKKAITYVAPLVKKGWETIKTITPKVQELLPQVMNTGQQIITAIKNRDASQIGNIVSQGQDIIKKGVDIGKDTIGAIREVLNHKEKIKEMEEQKKMQDVAIDTQAKEANQIRENLNANRIVTASNATALNPSLQAVGGETTPAISGRGLISKYLKKHSKTTMRGKGIKLF